MIKKITPVSSSEKVAPQIMAAGTGPTPCFSIHLQNGIKTRASTPAMASGIKTGLPKYKMVVVKTIARLVYTIFTGSLFVIRSWTQNSYP